MSTRRRYPLKENGQYHRRYDLRKNRSPILNTVERDAVVQLNSKGALLGLLRQWTGDENGLYLDGRGASVRALIPNAEQRLQEVHDQFEKRKEDAKALGKEPPKEPSADLNRQRLEREAELDVLLEEADKLKAKLAEFEAAEKRESASRVLRSGPIGTGVLKGNRLVEIDGQRVEQGKDKELFISDVRSPYNGMPVLAYRQFVVGPYLKARDERIKATGRPLRSTVVPRSSLPAWPDSVPRPETKEKEEVHAQ